MMFLIALAITLSVYLTAIILPRRKPSINRLKLWRRMSGISGLIWVLFMMTSIVQFEALFEGWLEKIQQNSGKMYLRDVRKAEMAYFEEKGTFTNNFNVLGWMPPDGPPLDYSLYFSASDPVPDGEMMARRTTEARPAFEVRNWMMIFRFHPRREKATLMKALDDAAKKYGIGATPESFTCVAVADLDDDAPLDVWAINDRGELLNVSDAIKDKKAALDLIFVNINRRAFEIHFYPLGAVVLLANIGVWIAFWKKCRTTKRQRKV